MSHPSTQQVNQLAAALLSNPDFTKATADYYVGPPEKYFVFLGKKAAKIAVMTHAEIIQLL